MVNVHLLFTSCPFIHSCPLIFIVHVDEEFSVQGDECVDFHNFRTRGTDGT